MRVEERAPVLGLDDHGAVQDHATEKSREVEEAPEEEAPRGCVSLARVAGPARLSGLVLTVKLFWF